MRRGRLIIAGAIVLVLVLLTFFFLVKPKRAELSEVRDQVAAEEQRTTQLRLELSRLQALQEDAPRLEAELSELREFVPGGHQIPNFIFLVQEAANRSGVGFVEITPELPKTPPEGAALAQVRVSVGASGGYFSVQDFIRRLYDLDRALRIDVVTMGGEPPEEGTDSVDIAVDLTLRIFFELPEGAAIGGTTTAPTTPAPGTSPTPAVTPTATPAG